MIITTGEGSPHTDYRCIRRPDYESETESYFVEPHISAVCCGPSDVDIKAQLEQLHKDGKVYNFQTKANESVKGIYLNCNGKDGDYGAYGNINPKKIAQELPF